MQVKRIPLVTQRAVVDRKAVGQPITWSKCKLSTAGGFPPCCTNINQLVIDVYLFVYKLYLLLYKLYLLIKNGLQFQS